MKSTSTKSERFLMRDGTAASCYRGTWTSTRTKSLWALLSLLFLANVGYGQNIFSGEPVQVVGRMQAYNTGAQANSTYRRLSVASGTPTDGRGQWTKTYNVQASGGDFTADNMPGGGGSGFLFISGPSGNRFANKWVFGGVGQAGLNNTNASTYQGSTDMGLNMGTNGRYTFVFNDAGYTSTNAVFYVGYTANAPVTVARTSETVNVDNTATIAITTGAAPSSGENVYVRYVPGGSVDFSGSTATSMVQATGSGTAWSATIPAQTGGTTVRYYIFTSTRTLAQLNAHGERDRSLVSLRYDDNTGANYSYVVPSGFITAATGDWNATGTWVGGVVPPIDATVTILNGHTVTLTADPLRVTQITISSGGVLDCGAGRTLTVASAGTLINNGTFTAGTSTVDFLGAVTLTGTYTFNNINIAGSTNLANSTINGTLRMNSGGFVSAGAPTYGSSSTLLYTFGYGISNEWTGNSATAGVGTPQNVTTSGSGTTTMPNGARSLAGNLTIGTGTTLTLSGTGGADLSIGGNLDNSAGTLTPNGRTIIFNGSGTQTLNSSATFPAITVNKSAGNLQLLSNITVGTTLSLTSGNVNLNGFALNVANNATINRTTGTLSAEPTAAGVYNLNYLSTVTTGNEWRSNGATTVSNVTITSGTITLGANRTLGALLTINSGTTLADGGFVLTAQGNVTNNGIHSGGGQILLTNGTVLHTLGGTGTYGNIELNEVISGDDAQTSSAFTIAGNLTITQGKFQLIGANMLTVNGNITVANSGVAELALSSTGGGDITLQGNLSIGNAGVLTNNTRAFFFTGTNTQTIEKVGGTLSLDYALINKSGGEVALGSNTIFTAVSGGTSLNFQATTSLLNLNNKQLTLSGTITNTGSSAFKGSTLSSIILNGTGAMGTLSFASGFRTLASLTINRSASGTATLGSDLSVAAINFTTGILQIGANTLTYTGATLPVATTTTYASQLGAGGFAWVMSSTAAGTYKLPIGPSGTVNGYRPVLFTTTGTTTATLRAGFVNTLNATASANSVPTTTNDRTNFIVNIDVLSGTLAPSTFTLTNQTGDFDANGTPLSIYRWTGAIWAKEGTPSIGGTVDGNNSISTSISNYNSPFVIGVDGGDDFSTYITKQAGNWNSSATWLNNAIPNGLTHNVVIAHNTTQTQNASVKTLKINTGITLTQNTGFALTIANNGSLTNNGGSFAQGVSQTGKVVFAGAATTTGTFSFYDVDLSGAVALANCTINGTLEIKAGGSVTTAPVYAYSGNFSVLRYNTGGTYNRNNEWSATSGAGYPNNVEIVAGTTLNLSNGVPAVARQIEGYIIIDGGLNMESMSQTLTIKGGLTVNGTLTLGSAAGGDLNVGGDFEVNSGATFTDNGRELTFNGGGVAQFIKGSVATLNIPLLQVNKSGNSLRLNRAVTVTTRLRLTSGGLQNSPSNITFGNGASIERTTGSINSAAPVFGTTLNITYLGSTEVTTGFEIPSSASVLNNLTVTNSGNIKMGGNATINGTLSITAGDLDLNGSNIVTLAGTSTLSESAGNTVINSDNANTGYVTATRTLNAPAIGTNIAGLGAYIGSAANLGSTEIRRYPVYRDLAASPFTSSIARIYRIVPTSNATNPTSLRFDYDDSELNGLIEAPLGLYRATVDNIDGTWNLAGLGGTIDATNNRLTGATVTSTDNLNFFWTLGGPVLRTAQDGPWNVGATWTGGSVPLTTENVQIQHNVYLSTDASINAAALSPSGSLKLYNPSFPTVYYTLEINNGGSLIRNGGTFDPGEGTVNFSGVGSVISGSIGFYNVKMSGAGGVNFGSGATINGTLEVANTGASVTANAPTFATGSTLLYNVSGTFNRGLEWQTGTIGTGTPHHVTIAAGTNLVMGTHADSRSTKGNITVNGTLIASTSVGGDFNFAGDWTRGASGVFTTNTRSVTFNGTTLQSIGSSGSNTTFAAVIVANAAGVQLTDDALATAFTLNTGSIFNLNTKKLTLVNSGTRTLTIQTGATLNAGTGTIEFDGNGLFSCSGTFNRGTSLVIFGGTPGNSTTLSGSVAINFHDISIIGDANFRTDALRGRLSGTMSIGPAGYVSNPPIYESGSTLRYNGGGNYNRTTEWDGTTLQNVTIANGTNLDMATSEADRFISLNMAGNLLLQNGSITLDNTYSALTVGGNVTLESGTSLTLSTDIGGDLYIGGNFVVNSTGFNANTRTVRFNGSGAQSISGTQEPTFQYLEITKSSGTLTLNRTIRMDHPTNAVTDVHFTTANSGTFDLNGFEINRDAANAGSLLRLLSGTLKTGGSTIGGGANTGFNRYTRNTDINTQTNESRLGGKVEYSKNGDETLQILQYNSLATSGSGTKSLTTSITIDDSLIVESGSTLSMGATTATAGVAKVFKVNGTVTGSSTGNVLLNGSTTQSLTGTGTVRNLQLSNASGANVTSKPTVSNTLTLTNGDFRTSSADTIVLGASATISETIGANDHYVIGNLKTVRTVNTNAESFGGMGISLTAGSDLGTVTAIRVSGSNGAVTANSNTGINRKWVVTPTVQPASGDRAITVTWPSDDDNGKDMTTIQLWKSPDGIQPYLLFGNVQNVSSSEPRTATVSSIASFSVITASESFSPLPVTLLYFSAKNENGNGYLYWATASERNNKGFFIEKSTDGNTFVEIGFVAAKADANGRIQYDFTDKNLTINSYYRLRQVDNDGSYEYSNKAFVKVGKSNTDVLIYPNPASNHVDIRINGNDALGQDIKLQLFSIEGREITTTSGSLTHNNQELNNAISRLAKGIYVVKITFANEIHTIRLVKE